MEHLPQVEHEPIVITATRSELMLFMTPATLNLVTRESFEDRSYRTLPEALRDVPGVLVQKTGHGQGSPFIRGFTGFRTLLLVDGIRLNNSVFRDGPNQYWNTIDPYSIDRLEIVKGPSSVLYGSDAIGGTVNVITRSAAIGGDGTQFSGQVFGRVSSAERSWTLRTDLDTSIDGTFGIHAGGTFKDFGDLQTGGGRQSHSGYEDAGGDFKFEYRVSDNASIVVAHQRVDLDEAWRTHKTVFARPYEGTAIGNERRRVLFQNRDLTYVQYHATDLDSWIDAAHVSVSHHGQSERRNRERSDGRVDIQGFDVDTLGLWAQFESSTPVGTLTYGAEYYRDSVNSYRRDFNADGTLRAVQIQGPVADNATYDQAALFIQNRIEVCDDFDLYLGARYTDIDVDADRVSDPETGRRISLEDDWDALVGSVRFIARLDDDEHWNLFGGVSQGFRAPNLSDLTRLDSARSNEIETPAPGLDPEEFISYEIGIRSRHENVRTQASYYYTRIDDMIIRQPTGLMVDGLNEVTKRNSGRGYVQGIELQGRWRFHPNLTAFGWVAWQDGEVDTFPTSAPTSRREPLSRLLPTTGQVGVRWDSPEDPVWLEGTLTIADRQDDLSTRDALDTQRIPPGGTPGYAVVSMRGGWEIDSQLEITGAIENITDENYRVHGSGLNEPGINFILGIEYRF